MSFSFDIAPIAPGHGGHDAGAITSVNRPSAAHDRLTDKTKKTRRSDIFLNILNYLKGKDTAFRWETKALNLGFIIY